MKEPGALAWNGPPPPMTARPMRALLDRLLAIVYGLGYDAVVRGFSPYQALLDEVVECVARVSGGPPRRPKVLDIACGTGTVAARLAREGYHVVGLDSVEHLVAVARRRYGQSGAIAFHHLDLARHPVPEAGSFDVVVSMHTLYWHPDPPGVLTACRAALRPGGHGIFLTYVRPAHVARTFGLIRAEQGWPTAVRALRWLLPTAAFEAARHYEPRYMSRDEFHRRLEQAGFEVMESRETFLAGLSLLALTRASRPAGR